MTLALAADQRVELERIAAERPNGRCHGQPTLDVMVDPKGKVTLPPVPGAEDLPGCCSWLTVVFNLDPRHPVIAGAHEGLRGPAGHIVLRRLAAPPLRFEPASHLNAPARLVEDLSWRMLPTDGAIYGFKADHARQISYVVRMLCGVSQAASDEEETAGLVGAYLQGAVPVEGHTTYDTSAQRYEAAKALQRDLDALTGRPVGPPRYLIDRETGELVIRVADLSTVARQYIGGSLARGWLDARIDGMGWQRARLDGHALPGRSGRQGPHVRVDVYRGHLPSAETSSPVTT